MGYLGSTLQFGRLGPGLKAEGISKTARLQDLQGNKNSGIERMGVEGLSFRVQGSGFKAFRRVSTFGPYSRLRA